MENSVKRKQTNLKEFLSLEFRHPKCLLGVTQNYIEKEKGIFFLNGSKYIYIFTKINSKDNHVTSSFLLKVTVVHT